MISQEFSWGNISKPVVVLAPMANITTLPFRSICKEMGADIVFTPMLSSNAIVFNPNDTLKIAEFLPEEQPVIVQVFGYDGDILAKAVSAIEKKIHPAGIDINMGCPAPKITGNESGSALLRDYKKAITLVKKVRESFAGQLSVKIRLGWDSYDVLPFVKELESIGVDAISVHGRTAKQGYSGVATWDAINEIAKSINIPVIGNGDILTLEDAQTRLRGTSLSGIMVGRGSLGNPWIFKSIKDHKSYSVTESDLKKIILKQTELSIKYLEDEPQAVREMRKHLGWYLKKNKYSKDLRVRGVLVNTLSDIKKILADL